MSKCLLTTTAFIIGFLAAFALFVVYYGPTEINQELGQIGERAMWKVWEVAVSRVEPNGPPLRITPIPANATPLPKMTWLPITKEITLENAAGFRLAIGSNGQQTCLSGPCKPIPHGCDAVGPENAILCEQSNKTGVLYMSPPWIEP